MDTALELKIAEWRKYDKVNLNYIIIMRVLIARKLYWVSPCGGTL